MDKSGMNERNLLLIDDESSALMAFKKLLETPRTSVFIACTMQEASDSLDRRPYHVVISDLRLSGTCGMEGLEILRIAKQKNPEAILILITAHGNSEIRKTVLHMGGSYYFEKPVLAADLRRAIAAKGGEI